MRDAVWIFTYDIINVPKHTPTHTHTVFLYCTNCIFYPLKLPITKLSAILEFLK